jgi:hypothetical protein
VHAMGTMTKMPNLGTSMPFFKPLILQYTDIFMYIKT